MKPLVAWTVQGRVLRAGLVTNESERDACLELRYGEYHDKQREIPTREDGQDIDWADEHSTLFCTKLDDRPEVAGTMRLIHCERGCLLTHGYDSRNASMTGVPAVFSGQPFRMPTVNPRTGEPVQLSETVEGSRYVAHQIELNDGSRVLHSVIFLEAAFKYCRQKGVKQIIGALRDFHFQSLRAIGWEIVELQPRPDGAPHMYHRMEYRVVFFPVPPEDGHDYNGQKLTPVPATCRRS